MAKQVMRLAAIAIENCCERKITVASVLVIENRRDTMTKVLKKFLSIIASDKTSMISIK